ncbi:HEAT repeat protein-like protein [Byssothecium circinans]|uniref:HEAT repeat protein-like protein n=1 Tax=Byssothecium circinans TaxID=147558 RepID=A0A6A5UA28_9PLEO|nr:HEAT repeat protein-like protein [Byssothecium circinans]
MERNQVFTLLKPACIEVLQVTATFSQQPNARAKLTSALSHLNSTLQLATSKTGPLDGRLTEYVFVPISQVLRISRTVPVRALELCLECILILLKGGWGGALTPELSGQLLILFTFMAKPSSAESGIAGSSEELQTLALKCMSELFIDISQTSQGKQHLTAASGIPALGEAVLVILDNLTDSPSNEVKLQAVNVISSLIPAVDDRDALASFLPRIVSSLTKILTPSTNNRASFRVLERSLEAMKTLFLHLLSDQATKGLSDTKGQGSEKDHKTTRSTSWLQATASQIKMALSNILRLRGHDKSEVRQALLQLCLAVVQECRTSLADCTGIVIETMVSLAGHDGHEDAVEKDLKYLLSADEKLSDLLRESLHGWVISLPRLMQSKDDVGRRQIINKVSVTLRLLHGSQIIIDNLLADNLRDAVSAVLSDSNGVETITESTAAVNLNRELVLNSTSIASFQPLQLRLKGQQDMMADFSYLLKELSQSDTAITVTQDLVNVLDSGSPESRLASFWISVNLTRDMMETNPTINDFIDLGPSNPQEELLDQLYSHSLSILTQQDYDSYANWHFPALALEVIALQASRYKTEFRTELSETLYPVLHYLGSPNPSLRSHAITCLNIIALSCSYTSASELVIANVDYIVNAVGLKLSYGDVSPQAPQVLLMMMRLCGPALLPYLDDLVGSIFGTLERYHGYPKLVQLLFAVLKGMVEEGIKAPQLAITAPSESSPEGDTQDEVAKMLAIIARVKEIEKEALAPTPTIEEITPDSFPQKPWANTKEENGDEEENDTPHQEAPKDPPPPAPRTFDILLKISELTQHYLTSSSPSLRTSLLSLLHTTVPALAKHENSFLPLINTLWPVLLPRLEDPEAYVVANALDIVALMCEHAGNFMRSRIDAAWGLFKSVHRRATKNNDISKTDKGSKTLKMKTTRLVDLSTITSNPNTSSATQLTTTGPSTVALPSSTPLDLTSTYTSAPTRMIFDALVLLLCSISRHVEIREEQFEDVLDMLDPVLERDDVKIALEVRNADAVWLRLYWKGQNGRGVVELGGPVKKPEGEFGWVDVGG